MANSGLLGVAMATHQLAACGLASSSWLPPSACNVPFSATSNKLVSRPVLRFIARASSSTGDAAADIGEEDEDEDEAEAKEGDGDGSFEERLAKLRRRVNSGTGVKAEKRKARKSGDYLAVSSAPTKSKGGDNVLLPPVPLMDPVSDGLRVELGFNSYTERINGRFAALGLAAVLLVELASGGSFLKYHESSVIGLQAYFMLGVAAVYIKYEKEKISIWPGPKS
eukprot:c12786_g1_i1 orf=60-731(+)